MSAETEKLIADAREHAVICTDWTACSFILNLADDLAEAEARADELQADYDHLVSQTEPTRRAQEEASRRAFAAEARAAEHESAAIEFCAAADAAEAREQRLREAAMALYQRVEIDESVGVCLSSRVEALNLFAALTSGGSND